MSTKKAYSAFSEATENTTNLTWLNEGESKSSKTVRICQQTGSNMPLAKGKLVRLENEVDAYPVLQTLFRNFFPCPSNDQCACALGLSTGTGQCPGREAGTGSLPPVLVLGPSCQHVTEAAWLGQRARSTGPWQGRGAEGRRKTPKARVAWLQGDSYLESRSESLLPPHIPCVHQHPGVPCKLVA